MGLRRRRREAEDYDGQRERGSEPCMYYMQKKNVDTAWYVLVHPVIVFIFSLLLHSMKPTLAPKS